MILLLVVGMLPIAETTSKGNSRSLVRPYLTVIVDFLLVYCSSVSIFEILAPVSVS